MYLCSDRMKGRLICDRNDHFIVYASCQPSAALSFQLICSIISMISPAKHARVYAPSAAPLHSGGPAMGVMQRSPVVGSEINRATIHRDSLKCPNRVPCGCSLSVRRRIFSSNYYCQKTHIRLINRKWSHINLPQWYCKLLAK